MVRTKVDYLTDIQSRILAAIRRAIVDDGEAPTVAELRAETGRPRGIRLT